MRSIVIKGWPYLIPWLGFGAIMAIMRPDAVAAKDTIPFQIKWLIYDECDLTALALRGANLAHGRLPGRRDDPRDDLRTREEEDLVRALAAPREPLQPRFFLEYPTPTLLLFRLGFLGGANFPLPTPVADGYHVATSFHVPTTDEERATWTALGQGVRVIVFFSALALTLLMLTLDKQGYAFIVCVLPGALFFSLNRFDIFPALATALAFAALRSQRPGWCGVFLTVGILWKAYPILFIPVILRYLGYRDGFRFLVGSGLTMLTGIGLSVAILDLEATIVPIQLQLSRPVERWSWTLYERVLPLQLAYSGAARMLILASVIGIASVTRPASIDSVFRRCSAILLVFVSLAVFWSPQWIIWFLPLLLPLAVRHRFYLFAIVALDLVNYFEFPLLFWILWNTWPDEVCRPMAEVFIYIRAGLWLLLLVRLVLDESRSRQSIPSLPEDMTALRERFLAEARTAGTPRDLEWTSIETLGSGTVVIDRPTGDWLALVPMIVQFEPHADSEMAAIPQSREPRTVVGIFRWDGREWATNGRAIFNLTPEDVIARSEGRYEDQSRSQTTTVPRSVPAAARRPSGE